MQIYFQGFCNDFGHEITKSLCVIDAFGVPHLIHPMSLAVFMIIRLHQLERGLHKKGALTLAYGSGS